MLNYILLAAAPIFDDFPGKLPPQATNGIPNIPMIPEPSTGIVVLMVFTLILIREIRRRKL